MTIENKAKEIFVAQEYTECENANDEMWMKRDAFERGAEWMLDKAIGWLVKHLPYIIDEKTFTVRREVLRDFEKAMKEE